MVFTAWSNSTTVENHLVGNAIVGLVVNHIGFAHIRPLNVVFIVDKRFKVVFTAWLNLTAVKNHLVRKAIVGLVINHIGLVHIRPKKVVLIQFLLFSHTFNFFKWVLPAGKISTGGQNPHRWKANSLFYGNTYRVCSYPTTRVQYMGIYMNFRVDLTEYDIAQIQMQVIPISVPGSSKFFLQMKEEALKYS